MEFSSPRLIEVNSDIIEYDIKHANTSLMRYYKIYPSEKLDAIDKMPKAKREYTVGMLCRDDKAISKKLTKSFDDIMTTFLETNDLTEDDLISIKKDAAFVINHKVKTRVFGCVEFAIKNSYCAYLKIPQYEFYIKKDGTADVKGIGDRDALDLHKGGILKFVNTVIELYSKRNIEELSEYLHEFVEVYKKRELPFEYYREFNSQSAYISYDEMGGTVVLDEMDESMIDEIDITFNYVNVILPIIRVVL